MEEAAAAFRVSAAPDLGTAVRERVRELRIERGWSQSELGRRIGATPTHVRKFEEGSLRISLSWLARFARVFETTAAALLPPAERDLSDDPDVRALFEILYGVAPEDRAALLSAARDVVKAARRIASERTGGSLPGSRRAVEEMVQLWSDWDDSTRDRAVDMLRVVDRIADEAAS